MKIILKQDVDNLGDAGDIVAVADGFANNFLMPRGLAMRATRGAVADAAAISRARVKREARSAAEAEGLRSRLEGKPLVIAAKAGEDGTLYGSIGNREIAQALATQLSYDVDRRKVGFEKPIKELGTYPVELRLHGDITATVQVKVVRQP